MKTYPYKSLMQKYVYCKRNLLISLRGKKTNSKVFTVKLFLVYKESTRLIIQEWAEFLCIKKRKNDLYIYHWVFGLLSSFYSQLFSHCIPHPSSDVSYQTQEPTECQTKPFIKSTGVDWHNSINHDWVQMLSYIKYSFYSTSGWDWSCNHQMISLEAFFKQMHISVVPYVLLDCVGSWVWHETLKEGRRTHQPKHCEYNNEDEGNSLNALSDKNYHASSQKFRQVYLCIDKP